MGVSLIRLGNACVEGVGCRVWRGVEPPRVEDYPIPISMVDGQIDEMLDIWHADDKWDLSHLLGSEYISNLDTPM